MTIMDPFEARLQFIQILETLNPSSMAMSKGVSFALKNQELHEDFHSCILEVLDRIDLNSRINVLYFIESLASSVINNPVKSTNGNGPYINNLKNDFPIIIKKVVPNQNLINLKSTSDILTNMENLYEDHNEELRNLFQDISLTNIDHEVDIKEDESGFKGAWRFLIINKQNGLKQRLKQLNGEVVENKSEVDEKIFTKDQILMRIEADRERHKRFKEVNWIVNRPSGKVEMKEFEKIWNQYGELAEGDYQDLKELNDIAKDSYQVN
ncbi:CTD kinase subunit gamma [Wickerhamomyces ciferrii]|uniref:CTD kinase subunit gamma n=1 Tax=Wickerhamomyces ciferrii (strain ATCC 14091 / BCRC 22168 / CBS 111 / JCM 3599 / NBRC 0793 / NRRL Y-1031 F-60-10) TaxID=1206466 RepID=K0KJG3_WICCF|nr:CTD kinase subunit gamma [Wickerhamomyces ciferrii]CCH45390.1 CTD kinase subunit gamma [Wickerhamomyces ciferrii]